MSTLTGSTLRCRAVQIHKPSAIVHGIKIPRVPRPTGSAVQPTYVLFVGAADVKVCGSNVKITVESNIS